MKLYTALLTLLVASNCLSQNVNTGSANKTDFIVTIPYQEIMGKIIFEGKIKSNTYRFLLDTGAPTCITEKVAKELGITPEGDVTVNDQSASLSKLKIAKLPEIILSDISFIDNTILIVNMEYFDQLGIDGIIGSNTIRESVVRISSKDHTITITDNSKKLPLAAQQASQMNVEWMQSHPYIKVAITDGKKIKNEEILFDTGQSTFYKLSSKTYKSFFKGNKNVTTETSIGANDIGLAGLAAAGEISRVVIPQITINGTIFKNNLSTTTKDDKSRIGTEILEHGIVTLDYKNELFYFEPYAAGEISLSKKRWPVSPTIKNGKAIVGTVWDESYNDKINVGDIILKFDTLDYENMSLKELYSTTVQIDKKNAIIKIKDAKTSEIKEFELESKD